jgi:hypothetical protein
LKKPATRPNFFRIFTNLTGLFLEKSAPVREAPVGDGSFSGAFFTGIPANSCELFLKSSPALPDFF